MWPYLSSQATKPWDVWITVIFLGWPTHPNLLGPFLILAIKAPSPRKLLSPSQIKTSPHKQPLSTQPLDWTYPTLAIFLVYIKMIQLDTAKTKADDFHCPKPYLGSWSCVTSLVRNQAATQETLAWKK